MKQPLCFVNSSFPSHVCRLHKSLYGLKHIYVIDYLTLMDCLISTQEDVQILQHSGIIENGLGDDGMVCSLFHKLGIIS
jgi:hypothetical protein